MGVWVKMGRLGMEMLQALTSLPGRISVGRDRLAGVIPPFLQAFKVQRGKGVCLSL